jgi:hypothetical protein
VYDFYNEIQDANEYLTNHSRDFYINGTFDEKRFWDYKLEKLQATTSRRKYTMDLTLTKIDNNWRLDNLLDEELQKIHGLYKG